MKGENNKAVYETVIRNWVVGDDIRIDDMTEDKSVLKNVQMFQRPFLSQTSVLQDMHSEQTMEECG